MTDNLISFSEAELEDLLELTRFVGYPIRIDMSDVDGHRNYGLQVRLIPIPHEEEE